MVGTSRHIVFVWQITLPNSILHLVIIAIVHGRDEEPELLFVDMATILHLRLVAPFNFLGHIMVPGSRRLRQGITGLIFKRGGLVVLRQ